jgi:hypothetical protein
LAGLDHHPEGLLMLLTLADEVIKQGFSFTALHVGSWQ